MKIAVTGHRPIQLGGYHKEAVAKLLVFAMEQVEVCISKFPEAEFITGMALGWDQAIAKACCMLDVPFHAYIPFIGQEKPWPNESKLEYKQLLDKAKSLTICSEGDYAAYKLIERNKQMVDSCQILLALWNGQHTGGTYRCVEYALQQQKQRSDLQVANVWNEWRNQ